jgi:hypothetical protein
MAGLPPHKYDLLPYSTTLLPPSSVPNSLNYTRHRPSKREYIESSDIEDVPSSPPRPRKYRGRKRREWRESSDIGYSSDVDDEDIRQVNDVEQIHRRRTRTVAGGERMEDILSSQESPSNKFHRILTAAIMEGFDRVDFS